MEKLCPLLKRTVVIHNDLRSAKTVFVEMNRFSDNDIIIEEFRVCYESECMFFLERTKKCALSIQGRFPFENFK